MFGAVVILSKLGLWIGTIVAARWGLKLALIAAVVGVYVASFAALVAAVGAARAVLGGWELLGLALQFLPSTAAIGAGLTLYLGSLATMKALDLWRASFGQSARIGGS